MKRKKTKADKRRARVRAVHRERTALMQSVMLGEGVAIYPAKVFTVDDPLVFIDALIEDMGQKIMGDNEKNI